MMSYAEARETLRKALDEIRQLANSRHADESGDLNEHLELLIKINVTAEMAMEAIER
jgi:hypothetical protein